MFNKTAPESYIWGSSRTNLTEVAQIICVKNDWDAFTNDTWTYSS